MLKLGESSIHRLNQKEIDTVSAGTGDCDPGAITMITEIEKGHIVDVKFD